MSVIISSNLTVNTNPADVADRPRILYDNVFQQGTVTASSENSATNGWLENAVDGGTYDWWEWTSTPSWLEVTLTTAATVDMAAIGLHTGLTFVFQYWNGSAWVDLHDAVTTTTSSVYAVIFSEVTASKFRIYISDTQDESILGFVMLGQSLQFPKTFYGGHAPITLNRTAQLVRNKTEAGYDAGVYSLRTGAATSVEINNCKPGWIRDNLEDLNKKLEIRPFIFAWRPSTYPNDVAYCWLNSPIRANNSGPRDLMTLQFDVNAFVGGGIVAPIIERLLINNSSSPYLALYEDRETGILVDSSPSGLTITGDAIFVDAHPKGIIASTFESDGTFIYEYSNNSFAEIIGPQNGYATGISIHSDQARWLAVTDKPTAQTDATLKIYKRVTNPDFTNGYYLDSEPAISGRYAVKFSPDGQMIVVGDVSNSKIAEFDADTGVLSNSTTISSAASFAWSTDSVYLATTANNLSIYKRSLIDNSFSALTVNAPTITQPTFIGFDRLSWHPDGQIIVIGAYNSHIFVFENNGSDVFDDVTSSIVSEQPSTLGTNGIHAVAWSPDGARLYIGSYVSGNSNLCVYDYIGGVLNKLYESNVGAGANSVGGMDSVRFFGTLSVIKPTISVELVVYDYLDGIVTLANAEGTYTIRPTVTPSPNVGNVISSVKFYVDDVLIDTVTASPFEAEIELVLADDLTTKVLKAEVFDLYGDMTEATFDLEIDYSVPSWTFSSAVFDSTDISGGVSLSNGDLTCTSTSDSFFGAKSDQAIPGKAYIETTVGTISNSNLMIGITDSSMASNSVSTAAVTYYAQLPGLWKSGSLGVSMSSVSLGDVIGVAVDPTSKLLWISINGSWQNGDPGAGSGGYDYSLALTGADVYICGATYHTGESITVNFGASAFSQTVPTGFNV